MTLPQLYTNVTLRSYDSIRYSPEHGRVEGSGMGSPFVMGLNGLVLRNVSGYVRQLRFVGEWREHDLEEFSKKGRVPDSSIILNTLVRVAIGRSANLRDLWYVCSSSKTSRENVSVDSTPVGSSIRRCCRPYGKVWNLLISEA